MVERRSFPPFVETITVTTNGSGAASVTSTNKITGEIIGIAYAKGTVNASTSAVVASASPAYTLDTYDVNGGSAYRAIGAKIQGSTDAFARIPITGSAVTVTVTGGAASKTFTVYIYYK